MNITIQCSRPQPDAQTHQYIQYRLGFAFARTRQFIQSIEVTLTDINGPKGGIDQQCKVRVKPMAFASIVITERQSEIRHAIDRCITRASRNFVQQMKRKQRLNNQRHSHRSLALIPEYN